MDTIYCEDCLETMSRVDNKEIDLVITSPPYNMNLRIRNGKYCSRQIVKEFSTKYDGFSDNLPIEMFYELHSKILRELLRVSKIVFYNIQIVTGSKRAFFKMIGEFSDYLKEIIVWDKGHAQPAMGVGVLNRQTELILVLEDGDAISRRFSQAEFGRGTLSDLWTIPRERSKTRKHSAVFPEALVEKILSNFSKVGDTVYDPFMGTGTTAVVAKRLGRRFLGSEVNAAFVDVANKRLMGEL